MRPRKYTTEKIIVKLREAEVIMTSKMTKISTSSEIYNAI